MESTIVKSRVIPSISLAAASASEAIMNDAPLYIPPKERFLEFRRQPSARRAGVLALIGALAFFGVWELGHYLTPVSARKFLPSIQEVGSALYVLFAERNFAHDVYISCWRIFISFVAAAGIGVPIGILMGSFGNIRALFNPTLTAWRYLPAASFIPLLLVWFGPTDQAKIALLFMGVIFFLISLVLDNTSAIQKEFVEAGLTMGASRFQILRGIVVPAALPAVFDFNAQHDSGQLDLPRDRGNRRRSGWHWRSDDACRSLSQRRRDHGWHFDDRCFGGRDRSRLPRHLPDAVPLERRAEVIG